MNDKQLAGGIGLGGLCFLWGIITQCLNWAGILQWPWYAIWGPIAVLIGIWAVALFAVLIIAVIAALIGRKW